MVSVFSSGEGPNTEREFPRLVCFSSQYRAPTPLFWSKIASPVKRNALKTNKGRGRWLHGARPQRLLLTRNRSYSTVCHRCSSSPARHHRSSSLPCPRKRPLHVLRMCACAGEMQEVTAGGNWSGSYYQANRADPLAVSLYPSDPQK